MGGINMLALRSTKKSRMWRLAGMGGSAVVALTMIVGPAMSAGAASAKGGGTFVERELTDFATLDPSAVAGVQPDLNIQTALYDRLVAPGPKGTVVPYVAKSWSLSPSAKSITFKLRSGVKCSGGPVLTATDIANSFDRMFKSHSVTFALTGGPFTAVPDDANNSITFTSEVPSPSAVYGFASPFAGIICPAGLANPDQLATKAFGSGPYTLVSATHNVGVVLKRNPDWKWGPNGLTAKDLPSVLKEEVTPNDTTAANELETGTLDGAQIAGTNVTRLLQDKSLDSVSTVSDKTLPLVMNESAGHPTIDPQVRRAIMTAIDPVAFSNAAFGKGYYSTSTSLFQKGAPCYAAATAKLMPKYSLANAKKILLADGYTASGSGTLSKNGVPLAVTVLGVPDIDGTDGLQYIAAQLTSLGMTVTTLNEPTLSTYGTFYVPGKWDVTIVDMSAPNPAPSTFMTLLSGPTPPAGTNYAYDTDAALTAAITKAEASTGASQCPAWATVQTMALRNYDLLPLSSPKAFYFAQKGTTAQFFSPTYLETETLHRAS
jgi:peptide/nickel transport system substrate-binding protein